MYPSLAEEISNNLKLHYSAITVLWLEYRNSFALLIDLATSSLAP